MRVVCVLLSPGANVQHAVKRIAECCLRLSPQVAVGEHWVFLEIGKCLKLYSEESVLHRLRVMLSRFGQFATLAIADDLPTALAFAHYKCKSQEHLPVGALTAYLNPFQYSVALNKMLAQLGKLGIYTLEEFAHLPRKTLLTRFGKEGLLAAQQLQEAEKIIWPHFKIEEKIIENLILSSAPDAIETLLFYIKTLADRVASRLLGRGERVSRFQLFIHQEKYSHVTKPIREFNFDLPLAQSAGVSLLSIIRERLSATLAREPLQSEVEFIELKVLESIPIKSSQRDFLNRAEEEREAWASLIGRLTEKLGPDAAFLAGVQASYLPEKAWSKLMKEDFSEAFDRLPSPARPLRIFKTPLPLAREGSELVDYNNNLSWKIDSSKSEAIKGPERIREEWWDFGSERDYYQIQTESGEKLWVFQRPGEAGMLLHGVFD